jgi:Ca-activated chloride channel family protein
MSSIFNWQHITFAHPYFFALLALVPLMIWWQRAGKTKQQATLRMTTLQGIAKVNRGRKVGIQKWLFRLRIVAIILLIAALARPQRTNTTTNNDTEGIDMVLSMDVSGSMLAEDFKPNRIEAAKKVALEFVDMRPSDRIGLVIFSGESFTMCPISIDHIVLKEQLIASKSGMIQDGTSIGMGLATAVDRLRRSQAKSKVIILMTDGVNNTGLIDPVTALEIAKAFKIRIYTIGIGTQGMAPMPVQTPFGLQKQMVPVEIDEPIMKRMAQETGGKYFRATGNRRLKAIYEDIDKLEKTKIEVTSYKRYAEEYLPFAIMAMVCLGLEMLLRYTVLKSITT